MPTKTGAGGAPQEYDESTGRYGGGNSDYTGKGREYRQNTTHEELTKSKESSIIKEQDKPKKLVYDMPETREFYDRVKRGEYYTLEELKNHPVVKMLDARSSELSAKYGDTSLINTLKRIEDRKKGENNFLSIGAMVEVGKDEKGFPIYEPKGEVKREHKAVIAIGLPAAGKSTRIANPASEEMGAFVFDSDDIKKQIPEFIESNGGAADAVHNESKAIQQLAFAHFLEGGDRQGDNLVIPVIGDNADKLYKKYISKLEAAGYDVEIKYQNADPVESLNRSIARAIETGRIIPSKESFKYGDKPRGVFEEYKTKINSKGVPYVKT